jgi:hypothetical protein
MFEHANAGAGCTLACKLVLRLFAVLHAWCYAIVAFRFPRVRILQRFDRSEL